MWFLRALVNFWLRSAFLANTPGVTPSIGGEGSGGGAAPSSGGGSVSTTPAPSTGAPGGSPTPSSGSPASGTPTPGQGQGSVDWATAPAHFRTAYEQAQQELARWKGLNVDHTVASSYVSAAQGMVNEAYKVGRDLGYKDTDIQEALAEDVINTLSFLRSAAARKSGVQGQPGQGGNGRQGQPQVDPQIKSVLDRLSPLEEHTNRAMADAANQAFTGEFDRLFQDHYKADASSVPKEVKELLFDAVSEMFKYNDKGMHALKFARNTQAVAETFKQVLNRFDIAMNAYHMQQLGKKGAPQGGAGGQPGAGGQGAGGNDDGFKGLTLDDIAQGDDRAVRLIPSMR